MQRCTMAAAMTAITICFGWTATARAEGRGVQFTPDGKRVLVNKDVGTERWAITLNENGSATGNVFRSDGGPPAFIFCAPLAAANTYECFGADACTDSGGNARGIQGVPDDTRVLVQKDVGTERWAMSLNFDDGTATGNVFRADGGEPAFVVCTPTGTPNEFDCSGADKCQGNPCNAPFTPIATVTLPESFFALPDPCNEAYVDLGQVTLPASFFVPPTNVAVTFTVGASSPVQAFQIHVDYSTSKGSFVGDADAVSCTTGASGVFTKNDVDASGRLTLSVANTTNLSLPLTIDCVFGAVATVASGDFGVTVDEVTQNNAQGNPSVLSVGVDVH